MATKHLVHGMFSIFSSVMQREKKTQKVTGYVFVYQQLVCDTYLCQIGKSLKKDVQTFFPSFDALRRGTHATKLVILERR